jgi:hypothetical protein
MLKFGKLGVALVLGLIMCLSLLTTGIAAQSVKSSNTSKAVPSVVKTGAIVGTTQAVQEVKGNQKASELLAWGPRGYGFFRGGFGFHRGFFFRRGFFFHRPRFFYGGYGPYWGYGGYGPYWGSYGYGCGC